LRHATLPRGEQGVCKRREKSMPSGAARKAQPRTRSVSIFC